MIRTQSIEVILPELVHAMQFTGDNVGQILLFANGWAYDSADYFDDHTIIFVKSDYGLQRMDLNDYIVKDKKGKMLAIPLVDFLECYCEIETDCKMWNVAILKTKNY